MFPLRTAHARQLNLHACAILPDPSRVGEELLWALGKFVSRYVCETSFAVLLKTAPRWSAYLSHFTDCSLLGSACDVCALATLGIAESSQTGSAAATGLHPRPKELVGNIFSHRAQERVY